MHFFNLHKCILNSYLLKQEIICCRYVILLAILGMRDTFQEANMCKNSVKKQKILTIGGSRRAEGRLIIHQPDFSIVGLTAQPPNSFNIIN